MCISIPVQLTQIWHRVSPRKVRGRTAHVNYAAVGFMYSLLSYLFNSSSPLYYRLPHNLVIRHCNHSYCDSYCNSWWSVHSQH